MWVFSFIPLYLRFCLLYCFNLVIPPKTLLFLRNFYIVSVLFPYLRKIEKTSFTFSNYLQLAKSSVYLLDTSKVVLLVCSINFIIIFFCMTAFYKIFSFFFTLQNSLTCKENMVMVKYSLDLLVCTIVIIFDGKVRNTSKRVSLHKKQNVARQSFSFLKELKGYRVLG